MQTEFYKNIQIRMFMIAFLFMIYVIQNKTWLF